VDVDSEVPLNSPCVKLQNVSANTKKTRNEKTLTVNVGDNYKNKKIN